MRIPSLTSALLARCPNSPYYRGDPAVQPLNPHSPEQKIFPKCEIFHTSRPITERCCLREGRSRCSLGECRHKGSGIGILAGEDPIAAYGRPNYTANSRADATRTTTGKGRSDGTYRERSHERGVRPPTTNFSTTILFLHRETPAGWSPRARMP